MANEDGLIREVDEGLAEDDFWRSVQKRGPYILGAAAAIVAGVAGFQVVDARKGAAAGAAAEQFYGILSDEDAVLEERFQRLKQFEEASPAGYSIVARFRIAGGLAADGDAEEAREVYRSIYEGDAAPKRLRQLARIRAAHLALDAGRDAVIDAVGDLETDASQFGFFAREALAFAALKAGDYATAAATFDDAAADLAAPEGVRTRAREFAALAKAATAGDGLEWPKPQTAADIVRSIGDDLTDAFGESAASAAAAALAAGAEASPADDGSDAADGSQADLEATEPDGEALDEAQDGLAQDGLAQDGLAQDEPVAAQEAEGTDDDETGGGGNHP